MSGSVIQGPMTKTVLARIYRNVRTSSIERKRSHINPSYKGIDLLEPRSRRQTRNLVNFLMGHAARARRAAQPPRKSKLVVMTPRGKRAVSIRFG